MHTSNFTRSPVVLAVLAMLAGFAGVFVPRSAAAHTFVADPPSRDTAIADLDARAHKSGPCGGSPRVGLPTQYAMGATVPVKFTETIGHRGCFQIAFSPANDTDWVTLKQVDDPAGPGDGEPDKTYTENVTLPAGVTCKACTLVVRQLMKGVACAADAVPGATDTYYSCADIRVGDFPDAGPTMPPSTGSDAGSGVGPGPSGGGTTTIDAGEDADPGTSGSGRRLTSTEADAGGCNVGTTETGGFSVVGLVGLGALVLRYRRRRP